MAGHIFLISCLLAICLPIVFVQLSRSEIVKGIRTENEAEKRSEVLRRRPLSPSWKILRWIARPWSETEIDFTTAGSGQEQVKHKQIAQSAARGRWHQDNSGTAFGADACADSGASSKEEELRKPRTEKKPWDPPFRRQLPRTELARKSLGGRLHLGTDAQLPHKSGRDMEARGVAVRLFPPDSVPEVGDVEGCSYVSSVPQTSQETLYRPRQRSPQQQIGAECLSSPPDGAQMHHTCQHHTLQNISPVKAREHFSIACKHPGSGHSVPQSQSVQQVTLTDPPGIATKCAPKDGAKGSSKACRQSLPLWQILLVTMGFLIFVFVFAILISHCLAWFIVYKTEARLGEVRSGLLRGGQMKLCLCGGS